MCPILVYLEKWQGNVNSFSNSSLSKMYKQVHFLKKVCYILVNYWIEII